MTQMSYREAIRAAMADAMREDDTVVLIGEDLRGGKGGWNPDPGIEAFGGYFLDHGEGAFAGRPAGAIGYRKECGI